MAYSAIESAIIGGRPRASRNASVDSSANSKASAYGIALDHPTTSTRSGCSANSSAAAAETPTRPDRRRASANTNTAHAA